jgi:predicted enzyme related to lactoylglutathione lyase
MPHKRRFDSIALACIILAPVVGRAGPPRSTDVAVAPQYDTTHVYVSPENFEPFVASLVATLGGKTSKQGLVTVTPTQSQTLSQLVMTPVGTLSVFGFKTPVPYPFGAERTGYLVKDLDTALHRAQADGAAVIVAPFPDAIGRDALIQWPGGVNMQLYWHTTPPTYGGLQTVPENRVYVSPDRLTDFLRAFLRFSHGTIRADVKNAPGVEIGKPGERYHDVLLDSHFGKMNVIATDGHLPWPYGRETTGYEVSDMNVTLEKARANGVSVLTPPVLSRGRQSAMLEFPGGYIAEVHAEQGQNRRTTIE